MQILQWTIILILTVCVAGCDPQPQNMPAATSRIDSLVNERHDNAAFEKKWRDIDNTMLPEDLVNITVDYLSNDSIKDTLSLVVPKGQIGKTQSTITITKSDGKVIYSSQFPTTSLIYGYDPAFDTKVYIPSKGVTYFRNHVKEYFDSTALLSEFSVGDNSSIDEYIDDRKTYDEVRINPKARYIVFSFGEENNNILVYDSSKDEVVDIGGFD